MKPTKLFLILSLLLVALMVVACGSSEPAVEEAPEPNEETAVVEEAPAEETEAEEAPVEEPAAPEEISGSIVVLTNRTDIVDTTFVEYAEQFNELYPNVNVEFEAMTDYPGEVKIRMNTDDYGDVLLIPNEITPDQLPDFFSPLGTVDELGEEYLFVTEKAFDGQVYGIPVVGNAQGIVYNKAVFAEAGITELPTTPEEFIAAMQMIKDNTDSVPYYTNYAAGWPLVQWEGNRGSLSCNPNYSNELAYTDAPFSEGSDHYTMYKMMYDLVANELVEADPSTSDWESSKSLLGTGEIASMVLGSWSIVQMQEAADNPADIGYMPFPSDLSDTLCSSAGGDWKMGINIHSENQEASRAWVGWFLHESGFAGDQGGIPPVIGQPFPETLAAFEEMNVELVSQSPAPAGEEGWVDNIDSEAEIGLWSPPFRQRIVDAARGNSDETIDDIFADLNGRWAEARAEVVGDAEPAPAEEVVVEEAEEMMVDESVEGSIVVLTNRTDIVDTTFVEYAEQFNELYPNVNVEFEAMTDYPGEVKIRMNTDDYGDVLLIPNEITPDQLADFFLPLGSVEELDEEYLFVTEKAFDGQVYGLPVVGNAQGIVYNKAVFAEAGVTELPTTPEEFLAAMQMIKDNTDSVPYYTNYAAGWPLVQWEGNRGALSCNPDYTNEMAYTDAPFGEGSDHYTMYKLMYDLVANELVEADPSTSDWESSKSLLGTGEIASMVLGSWSIVQMQEAADNPADIGYMPFPSDLSDTLCSSAGGDWKMGINIHSESQEAARAWVNWFLHESGFAGDQGGIPPVKGQPFPETLAAFEEMNVELVSQNPAPAGEEGWVDNIDSEAEIGLWSPPFRQRIVDAARGNSDETIDDIFADLNGRWADARAEVVGDAEPAPAEEVVVEEAEEMMVDESVEGSIVVLTNRTDIVDTTFVEYAEQFNELYPNVDVEFEAMTDYPGEVKIRMNTDDYGDVLLIPNEITPDQLADFFSPLGSVEELDEEYLFVTEKAFDGQVYGLPVVGNAQGIVYNKAVFAEAGVTELPTTPEEFIAAMQMIKDNTDSVPYYTNYAAGWPLVQWEGNRGALSCNPDYTNEMAYTDAPFSEGSDHYAMYKLMYDLVANGLVEADPSTSDWESSKSLLGTGEIASMVLGSWSIVQMQDAADNPADIGYMPFPSDLSDTLCSSAGGDWKMGINIHSESQEAARAWVDWFLHESGFAGDQGGIPPVIGQPFPETLAAFEEMNVELVSQNPAPAGEEGWVDNIDSEAEIGLWSPPFRQRIVDAARGNSDETIDDIFADLNGRWAEARAEVVGE